MAEKRLSISMTVQEFESLIKEVFKSCLKANTPELQSGHSTIRDFLPKKVIAKILSLTLKDLNRIIRDGEIIGVQSGTQVHYKLSDVQRLLTESERRANHEL